MRKRSKLSTFVVFVLLLAMVCLILVSNTYAKYTSTASGTSTATIASWSVTVNDEDITDTQSLSINLFETVKDTDTGSTETEISSTSGMIAPGTYGCFELTVVNASDVTASVSVAFTQSGSEVPLVYALGDSDSEDVSSLSWSSDTSSLSYDDNLDYTDGTATMYVYWMWEYENSSLYSTSQSDYGDTTLGTTSGASVILTVDVTATQVD